MIHQTARFCDLLPHLLLGVFSGEAHRYNILYRELSAAGWRHRAVTVGDIVGIYHFAVIVSSYRDSTADMTDDQV